MERVAIHLESVGYESPIMKPYTTTSGELTHTDGESVWRLLPFVRQSCSLNTVQTPEQAQAAAAKYGELLYALRDLPADQLADTIPHFHDPATRRKQFDEAIANALPERLKEAKTILELFDSHRAVMDEMERLFNEGEMPLRVVHNDTKINNILFDRTMTRATAVVDWDTLMGGTVVTDFGDMVRTFVPSHGEESSELSEITWRMPIFEAVCKGFAEGTKDMLTAREASLLVRGAVWIIYEQMGRFLADYLLGDVYYKTDWKFHNLGRAFNQGWLLLSIVGNYKDCEEIVEKYFSRLA